MKRLIFLFTIWLVLLTGASCNRSGQTNNGNHKQEIKTDKVCCTEVLAYIEATGSVQPDLEGTSKILSPLAGVINRIEFKVGDRVHKGDPLIAVTAPDVTDAYSNYLSSLTQVRQAERIYNLNKQLFEIGAVTRNDLLNSEAAYRQLTSVVEGLKSKLEIYGFKTDDDSISKKQNRLDTILIKAPMSGYIADIQTHIGDRVDASVPLMTLADPQKIMVVANIYDTETPKVKKGKDVTFYVDTFPGVAFKGVITYVSDVSDVESKTVKAFIKVLDRKDLFKQNMFLKIKIEEKSRFLPVIAQSAMIYKEGKFYVYVPDKEKTYALKEIHPVKEMPDKTVAVEGLKEGDTIVISAIELERP
jgi:cobalt-zinc-cadmium efflux system membrane fusion protein